MEENKNKPTYEELEKVIDIKNNQLQEMYNHLQEANNQNIIMRLQFLFEVLHCKESFSESFVYRCADEIEKLITIPSDTEVEKEG